MYVKCTPQYKSEAVGMSEQRKMLRLGNNANILCKRKCVQHLI
jgi:hypothetical protein